MEELKAEMQKSIDKEKAEKQELLSQLQDARNEHNRLKEEHEKQIEDMK